MLRALGQAAAVGLCITGVVAMALGFGADWLGATTHHDIIAGIIVGIAGLVAAAGGLLAWTQMGRLGPRDTNRQGTSCEQHP